MKDLVDNTDRLMMDLDKVVGLHGNLLREPAAKTLNDESDDVKCNITTFAMIPIALYRPVR